ncbi:MAG TPA: ATP-binding protein [Verrucomicrobiae bacterium]|jgi:signal transduction histidine kinase/DNA-binding NarL/FixJ family response regulator|nr:ATP-binding protein [Verrucomicrobiae bacterium]
MKTLLILAEHPEFPEAIRAGLNLENYRIVHCSNLEEAEPLLHRGLLSACILDLETADVRATWVIEKLRRQLPNCPLIVFTSAAQRDWEEEAYLKGVSQVLTKPIRPRLLNNILERIFSKPAPVSNPSASGSNQPMLRQMESARPAAPVSQHVLQALEVLRHFSAILTHSLDSEAMLKKFLLLLRETVGVNRAAIFLREPSVMFTGKNATEDTRSLRKACAMGLPNGLLEHFELSFESGIGGHIFRSGRILRRNSEEARHDVEMQQEFELLGAQVAIPILDREVLIGIAVFDGRLTGEPLVNGELELIFHLLEELALAIKNIWLHDQLAANHEMMADIFRQLSGACLVVRQDLTIIHANKAARNCFSKGSRRNGELEFSDLPPALGSKVYQVLKTGTAIATFKYQPEDSQNAVFNVSVVPFQKQGSVLPASALLMADDLTQSEQLRKLEIEAANLRLVTTMADRLAHEIGNALVPLSTHQQLLKERYKDPEFRATLEIAMADGIKRVSRLINQMRFLARDSAVSMEAFPMEGLIADAFEEAQKHQSAKASRLEYKNGAKPIIVKGDRTALKHALSEVMLNALQANPTDPKIGVNIRADANGEAPKDVEIEILDNGAGFKADASEKIPTPFFTTRNVGLGLGLTVSRKIIERHHGKLEIVASKGGSSGVVRITLPVAPAEGFHIN